LPSHALVHVGSLVGDDAEAFTSVLWPGGRVDFDVDGTVRTGRLHLGFALLGDLALFGTSA
jgi:hypothetical protein